MISLILDTRSCMRELLLRETFDPFLLIEGEITTFNKFTLDGYIRRDFYEDQGSGEGRTDVSERTGDGDPTAREDDFSSWKVLREFCLSIMKGKRTPLDFKLVFSLSQRDIRRLIRSKELDFDPGIVQGLYLNFRFDGERLVCITGTSYRTFTMDKSLEQAFDQWVKEYFTGRGIEWES